MRRIFPVVAILLVWVGSVMALSPSGQIVPGKRIGPVALGMYHDEVVKLLGNPSKSYTLPEDLVPYQYLEWDKLGLKVTFTPIPTPRALLIETTSKTYATDKGLRVGSSGIDLVQAYGSHFQRANQSNGSVILYYYNLGIVFGLSPDNAIRWIRVKKYL